MGTKVIVVDTNVLSYLVIRGPHSDLAERVRAMDSNWQVPALFYHEWLSVVTRYVARKIFERDEADRVYRRGVALVKVDSQPPDPLKVLNLHLKSKCTSYDCEFIEMADRHPAKMVTEDKEVLRAFPGIAVSLNTF